jgi:hypothetical protein
MKIWQEWSLGVLWMQTNSKIIGTIPLICVCGKQENFLLSSRKCLIPLSSQELHESGFSTAYTPFCLICTNSELTCTFVLTYLSELGLISADSQWTGWTWIPKSLSCQKCSGLQIKEEKLGWIRLQIKPPCVNRSHHPVLIKSVETIVRKCMYTHLMLESRECKLNFSYTRTHSQHKHKRTHTHMHAHQN